MSTSVVVSSLDEAEQWRDIPNCRGEYQASTHGRVRSIKDGRVMVLKPGSTGKYHVYSLWLSNTVHRRYAHRIILETFVGPCPDGMEGCHEDGVRGHNWLSNLRWDTRLNNHADKERHGTRGRKLTSEQVRAIRHERALGFTLVKIAEKYGITFAMVSHICRRKAWRDIV
jgi:hypothetical protein